MSTLDLTDGAHTVKVKTKADGYKDSEFSNEVSYTKSSVAKYDVTLNLKNTTSFYAHVYVNVDGVRKVNWDISDGQTSLGTVTDGEGNPLSVPITLHGSKIFVHGSMGSAIKEEQNIAPNITSPYINTDTFDSSYTVTKNGYITLTNIKYDPYG